MFSKEVLPEPINLGLLNPVDFSGIRDLADQYGKLELSTEARCARLVLENHFVFQEGALSGHGNWAGSSPAQETAEALDPVVKLVADGFYPNSLLRVQYFSGMVPPGKALMPPPLWHVDNPQDDNSRILFVSNVDPTLTVTGTLRGTLREDYIDGRVLAAGDDETQDALRGAVERAIARKQLRICQQGEYEIGLMTNKCVHRPQVNERKYDVFREALRIFVYPARTLEIAPGRSEYLVET